MIKALILAAVFGMGKDWKRNQWACSRDMGNWVLYLGSWVWSALRLYHKRAGELAAHCEVWMGWILLSGGEWLRVRL